MVALGLQTATHSDGTFIAINTNVSQSVPHLHVHVVPRRKGDGMKGFFWPRHSYESDAHARRTQEAIRRAVEELRGK
jgi:histidine triad (HIT) family protein